MLEQSRDPSTHLPLNPPDVAWEDKQRELEGRRPTDEQQAFIDQSDTDNLGSITPTDVYEGELEAGINDDLPDDAEQLELLTELELRDGETDDPMEAVQEGYTYVPPIDPPITSGGGRQNVQIASGLGLSAYDEPYDADHHDSFLSTDDEMTARVREALRADSSTTAYADRIQIAVIDRRVILRGTVDDLLDSDNLLAVAEMVEGVEEVVDQLRIRGL